MANHSDIDIARPYARAVFQLALQEDAIDEWVQTLTLLSDVVAYPKIEGFLRNPARLENKVQVLIELCHDELTDQAKRMLAVLGENRRLNIISELNGQFQVLAMAHARRKSAVFTSAFPLTTEQSANLRQALERRIGSEVEVTERVDQSLIGGIVIRLGDQVIDDSLRGRLNRLARSLRLP